MDRALRRAAAVAVAALLPAVGAVAVLGSAAHAATPNYPAQYAAPYLELSSADVGDMTADMNATGLKYYTLAFLIPQSGCTPMWENGNYALNTFTSQVHSLQSAGGNVIISFGGAAGGELAQTCTSVSSLTAAYQNVVNTYGVNRLDFDIEGSPLDDTASISRRDQALAALQAADPAVQVDYTLPVDPTGLPSNAVNLLNDAKSKGVKVNLVNIMTMDFGDGENALADAKTAATGTHSQLGSIFGGTSAQQWNMIGLTPIAGQNDDNEVFSQSDAANLESFAAANGVQELAFWEVDAYDKATGYAYSKTFNKITSTTAGNDFSLSASPSSGSLPAAGGTVTSTISTAVTSGSAESVALSATGGPAGSSVSFSPTSVTSGASSTLTVTTSATTAAGTYPITVTGTAASGTHTTTFTLTVGSSGGGSAIVNGGFETGDFTGWTRSGTTAIVGSPVHSGSHAALLGSANPTNGDSSVSQAFTAPSGSSTLSFWYDMNCPDDVTYDWATATLADTTAGTTATVLAKTCTLNQGWKQVTASVTPGHSYTLKLVSHDENNPGDATDTTYDDVTVNGGTVGNDFSLSASPASASIVQGSSATSTISTSVTSGSAESVALSATGLPSGAAASFSPASVTSGGSSTLTLTAGSSTPAGTYPITVTGTAASGTHTATYSLTVTSAGGSTNAIVNGGFETGDFTGWTRSGTTAIVGSPAHSGAHAALLGSANPTNGDSKISQTFTAPAGSSTVSFWYDMNCPDDVTYDWATATLADTTAGTTATVLAKTCTLNQGWKQVTSSIVAGHSYTITLVSHDEDNPGDATDTTYDDVATS